jgi:uncharacterized delta-60 repeat protein
MVVLPWKAPPGVQAAGDLDPTFGTGGIVTTDFYSGTFIQEDVASAVAIQPDGKLVVAGYTYNFSADSEFFDVAVARYNPDGSLDPSFGAGGRVVTDLGSPDDTANDVAIGPGGKILVAGSTRVESTRDRDFALVCYNPDGSLDQSFGTGGVVTTDINGSIEYAHDILVKPDGKILVAGDYFDPWTPNDLALVRYDQNGDLDPSFGAGGIVLTAFGGSYSASMALQPDGKIVVAGEATYTDSVNYDFALARYDADGSLDLSFGSGGLVRTDFGGSDWASCVALQEDGKIVAAGTKFTVSTGNTIAVARYGPDGNLDASFGADGLVTGPIAGTASSVVARPGGGLYVAGANYGFALALYSSDGSLDTSFGVNGVVTADFGTMYVEAYDLALQPDGKVVAVGLAAFPGTGSDFAVARWLGPATTPQAAIQLLMDGVSGLASLGVLNHGQANALMAKLRAAAKSVDKGNNHAAANQVRAFINQVNAFINAGKLTPMQGAPLIQGANEVINSLDQ